MRVAERLRIEEATGGIDILSADHPPINTSTTLEDILSVAVAANTNYVVDGIGFLEGDPTPDIKIAFTFPAGATCWIANEARRGDSTTNVRDHDIIKASGASITWAISGGVAEEYFVFKGAILVGATAGNLTLQAAQQVSNGSDLDIKAGSYLRVMKA